MVPVEKRQKRRNFTVLSGCGLGHVRKKNPHGIVVCIVVNQAFEAVPPSAACGARAGQGCGVRGRDLQHTTSGHPLQGSIEEGHGRAEGVEVNPLPTAPEQGHASVFLGEMHPFDFTWFNHPLTVFRAWRDWPAAGVCFERRHGPIKGVCVEVVSRHDHAVDVGFREFLSPSTHPHAGGTQRVQHANGRPFRHQPIVGQRVGQQHHGTGARGSHGRIEEARADAFCRSTWACFRPRLVRRKVDHGPSFQPEVAGPPLRLLHEETEASILHGPCGRVSGAPLGLVEVWLVLRRV